MSGHLAMGHNINVFKGKNRLQYINTFAIKYCHQLLTLKIQANTESL